VIENFIETKSLRKMLVGDMKIIYATSVAFICLGFVVWT